MVKHDVSLICAKAGDCVTLVIVPNPPHLSNQTKRGGGLKETDNYVAVVWIVPERLVVLGRT